MTQPTTYDNVRADYYIERARRRWRRIPPGPGKGCGCALTVLLGVAAILSASLAGAGYSPVTVSRRTITPT